MNMILAIALLAPAMHSGQPAPARLPFLIGVNWDGGAPKAAQDLFLETGCNFVRLAGGGYGWSEAEHERALKILEPHGIKVILQLGSHWPDGKYLDRKADYFVDDQGKSGEHQDSGVSYSGQFWPEMSYASPGYRQSLEVDFAAYLDGLKQHKNVTALLLHNEPGYFWVDGRIFDYNPQSIARFRSWLPTQYSSVSELDQKWGSSFASFEDVNPPKERPPVTHVAAWMDWRRFNAWMIQDFLRWEAGFARKVRPDLPNMTNMSGPLDNWYPLRLGDNYRFASSSDAACIDIYPGEWSNRFFEGFSMDMSEGVAQGRPVVVAECESYDPKSFTGLTPEQLAERLRCDLWTYIGHGARGVLIWSLDGQDGFVLTHGEFNPRLAALRETAHEAKMIGLDGFGRKRPEVAICVDQDAFLYFGGSYSGRDGAIALQQSVQGAYAALAEAGRPTEIICTDDVCAGKASRYKALVMATPAIADPALVKGLGAFVKGGGVLIAENPCGLWDRWGAPADRGALGLDALFGARVSVPASNRAAGLAFDWGARYRLELDGAKLLSIPGFGQPVGVVHSVGRGTAVLLDSNISRANADASHAETRQILTGALDRYAHLSPTPATATADGFVDTSSLSDAKGNVLYVFSNPVDKKAALAPKSNVALDLRPGGVGTAQVFGFETSVTSDGRVTAGAIRLPTLRSVDGLSLLLPHLTAVEPVLVARDHEPLLSIACPAVGHVGSKLRVQVTVWNPSPKAVRGILGLDIPPGWVTNLGDVRIAPWGSTTVDLTVSPAAGTRATLMPVVRLSNGPMILGVPVDVSVPRS